MSYEGAPTGLSVCFVGHTLRCAGPTRSRVQSMAVLRGKRILFDIDGTLIDSTVTVEQSFM